MSNKFMDSIDDYVDRKIKCADGDLFIALYNVDSEITCWQEDKWCNMKCGNIKSVERINDRLEALEEARHRIKKKYRERES